MDCEKFESVLVDELYDELDELTRAAAKRHVAGCARCAARLNGLRATRRLAVLPIVEPPADLEDRILAAASDAQAQAPLERRWSRRLSRGISWAGSWAMRPQTAMAALFLLMIGSSALLLRGTASKSPERANVTVSEQGAPVASAVTGTVARPSDLSELASADNAHGTPERRAVAAPAPPPAEAQGAIALLPTPAPSAMAKSGGANGFDELVQGSGASARKDAPRSKAMGEAPIALADEESAALGGSAMASRAAPAAPKAAAPAAPPATRAESSGPAGGAPGAGDPFGAAASDEKKKGEASVSDFDAGMNAYRAHRFVEATRLFDGAAASGDVNAALWAARSVREQSGCGAAVPRLDQLSARAFGTTAGYDATLEAGRCYRLLGSPDAARTRLVRLLTVKTHAGRAQAELDAMAARPAKPAAESY